MITLDAKRDLCARSDVTLNGEPARITGALSDYARVVQIKSGLGCEWAWPTVAHIVAKKAGAFIS